MAVRSQWPVLLLCVAAILHTSWTAGTDQLALPLVSMDQRCGQDMYLPSSSISTGWLRFIYISSLNDCTLTLRAHESSRLAFLFTKLTIRGHECSPFIQLQSMGTVHGLPYKICSSSDVLLNRLYVTSGNTLTIRFSGSLVSPDTSFHILFSEFHTGLCEHDEYRCDNGHCIQNSLVCYEHDICGDGSSCREEESADPNKSLIAGVVGAVLACSLTLTATVCYICYRRRRRLGGGSCWRGNRRQTPDLSFHIASRLNLRISNNRGANPRPEDLSDRPEVLRVELPPYTSRDPQPTHVALPPPYSHIMSNVSQGQSGLETSGPDHSANSTEDDPPPSYESVVSGTIQYKPEDDC